MRGLAPILSLTLLLGCPSEPPPQPEPLPVPGVYAEHPEPPTILRDVALIDDDANFTRPYVHGHRTTMDGRVALRVQGGPPGDTELRTQLSFYLLVPEALEEPILPGPPGARILPEPTPIRVDFPPALEPGVERFGHHALCDPTEEFAVPGERPNPYACGPEDRHDCYDITVVNATSTGLSIQLWGTPVTVEVSDPKTANARLVSVDLGEPVAGTTLSTTAELTEPAVTIDGRLLTFRLGRFPREWTNPETGESFIRPYDLAYSVLPPEADPCDITGWTDVHPMSHAPYDPAMVGTYGLAAYPFRDTEGNPIEDGEDMGGTYPWVDREGANVFMTGVHGRLSEQSDTRFPRRCVVEGCEIYPENIDWDRGFLVAGLWTHGKLVHLDGMINNQDWAVGVTPETHWMVEMYQDADGAPTEVRFGGGRYIEAFRGEGPYPDGYTHNANILDSLQNLPNFAPAARPVTPRDVVWVMSSGVGTDEIAFDDLLDPDAFIVANMQASITQLRDEEGRTLAVPKHNNGQVRIMNGIPLVADYELFLEADEDIHLQNGATSLRWDVPAYGLVAAGTGRVEPVALGGVQGRGFWLSGTNEIVWRVPGQPRDVGTTDWYVGIHLDPRSAEDEVHHLFDFPDGTGVRLAGRSSVQLTRADVLEHEVPLPPNDGWVHLAWRIRDGGREITTLVNGFALDRWEAEAPTLQMTAGDFVVGRAGEVAWGVRGWIDDLVVLAHDVDPEVACNHAGGTLAAVSAGDWADVAARYPDWSHDAVAAASGVGGPFVCFVDHTADYAAHLANLPTELSGVRDALLFPEGPLMAGAPRPDSTNNAFCLSCHHTEGRGGLGVDALELRPTLVAEDDPRRQPTQPPRRVFGNIPAGWIPPADGPGSPAEAMVAPDEGALIDRWVLRSAD